jgi:hypothetical protein
LRRLRHVEDPYLRVFAGVRKQKQQHGSRKVLISGYQTKLRLRYT